MRIDSVRVQAFGQISDLELKDLDHRIVVLLGANEAGKSTLFEFFKMMLYGIYPATSAKHPYAPWSGAPIKGSLEFSIGGGERFAVTRKLSSAPEGRITNGSTHSIRNQTIDAASHVSRDLFDAIYALSLSDMAAFEDQPWRQIQDRLLGTLSLDIFKPVGTVIKELDVEAGDLWRANRRGKPKARELESQINRLKGEAREASQRTERVRILNREVGNLEVSLVDRDIERRNLQDKIQRIHYLAPLKNLREEISASTRLAGDQAEICMLPLSPRESMDLALKKIAELESEQRGKKERLGRLQQDLQRYGEEEQRLVKLTGEIRSWAKQTSRIETLERQAAELELQGRLVEEGLEKQAAMVFSSGVSSDVEEKLEGLDLSDLRARIEELRRSEESLEEAKRNLASPGVGSVPSVLYPSVGFAMAGVLLILLSQFLLGPFALALGIALAFAGIVTYAAAHVSYRREVRDRSRSEQQALARVVEARLRVDQLLKEIPVPQSRFLHPDSELIHDLAALKGLVSDKASLQVRSKGIQREIDGFHRDYSDWLKERGFTDSLSIEVLEAEVGQAVELRQKAETANAVANELNSSLEELSVEMEQIRAERETLESILRKLGDGDIQTGLDVYEQRREAASASRQLRQRLEKEYPDWKSLEDEIAQLESASAFSPETISSLHEELDGIQSQLQELERDRSAKEKELEHLLQNRSGADVLSEIESLQDNLTDVCTQRDRLAILSELIKRGEQRFREKHQPDVLKRASRFLATISENRYVRVDFNEESRQFEVFRSDQVYPLEVSQPLSRGTLDQIYLCLRLALVEHLDKSHEALPLFLDEVLVNWDSDRRKRGFKVLSEFCSSHQVFVFTCHPWLAEEFVSAVGARCLEV